MFRILIVCTGNLCRSPMAEGILRSLLDRHGLTDRVEVRSAGTWGLDGDPASENAVEAAAEAGIDISRHRAARLTRSLISEADLILTMEPVHREQIVEMVPEAGPKTEVLTIFADPEEGDPVGVDDPFGSDLESYRATFEELDHMLRVALPRMLSSIEEGRGAEEREIEG